MSVIEARRSRMRLSRSAGLAVAALGFAAAGAAGAALATSFGQRAESTVAERIARRLPRTPITHIECGRIGGLCEVTSRQNLFYVDASGRYLLIGRVYDMATRQDLTAARLLEINPDMLVGGSARANASADEQPATGDAAAPPGASVPHILSLAGLPENGAAIWGKANAPTVTIFTDFRCGYCRALNATLATMNLRVVERPISVLGSRDIADRVWCAPDRAAAIRAAYADAPIAVGRDCDTSGLDANERFARAHNLGGTPVIVRSDGATLEGFRPKAFLERWIKEARS